MQSISSRIWTRVTVSISYDDNHYTTCTSTRHLVCERYLCLNTKRAIWTVQDKKSGNNRKPRIRTRNISAFLHNSPLLTTLRSVTIYKIYTYKKNSTDPYLAIMNLFQQASLCVKPNFSGSHHIIERKKIIKIFFKGILNRLQKWKKRKNKSGEDMGWRSCQNWM